MITKNDCMSILVHLGDQGIAVNPYIRTLAVSPDVPIEVLKFIVANRGIEVANFYEMLRKRYNQHKSTLYKNIVQEQEIESEIIIILASFLTQIGLYGKKLGEADSFYKEVRAEEVSKVLHEYFETGDITIAANLLKLIKSDIMVLEYAANRRELQ